MWYNMVERVVVLGRGVVRGRGEVQKYYVRYGVGFFGVVTGWGLK